MRRLWIVGPACMFVACQTAPPPVPQRISVHVCAATDLAAVARALADDYVASHATTVVDVHADSVEVCATRVKNHFPTDLVIIDDAQAMTRMQLLKLVRAPRALATNTLVMAVTDGNPAHVVTAADLATPGVRVALAPPNTALGAATRELLEQIGLMAKVRANVVAVSADKSALMQVRTGDADVGVVLATSVVNAPGEVVVKALALPTATVTHHVARTQSSSAAADAFVQYVQSQSGQAVIAHAGFAPP